MPPGFGPATPPPSAQPFATGGEVPDPAVREPEPSSAPPPPAPAAAADDAINLNTVTFEQLRSENLSVTQATRLLAHRERLGGFNSVDDLDGVAGFPQDVLAELKSRATV